MLVAPSTWTALLGAIAALSASAVAEPSPKSDRSAHARATRPSPAPAGPRYRAVSRWESASALLGAFNFVDLPDPSGGFVQYVNASTARANRMYGTGALGGLRFGADMRQIGNGAPRRSIRLESKGRYGQGLFIWDVGHMPTGCGTWPALWTYTGANDWPYGGEVDVVEGVNGVTTFPNAASLHTGPNCLMPSNNAGMTGTRVYTDCNSADGNNNNAGCGAQMSAHPAGYGAPFNAAGGGVYAYERTASALSIWFWPRAAAPAGTRRGDLRAVNVAAWGTPDVYYPLDAAACSPDHINADQILVANIDFCGGYVASRWTADGCAAAVGDCIAYTSNTPNPQAYWDINAIKIFKQY